MGYSIATPIRTTKTRDKMWAFLQEHYRPASEVFGRGGDYAVLCRDGDICYDKGKCRIGYDFNTGGPERHYIFAVVRWLALKVGKTRKTFADDLKLDVAVPYYVYDGYEYFPVIPKATKGIPKMVGWAIVDKLGWKKPEEWTEQQLVKFSPEIREEYTNERDEYESLIVNELKRLDKLWRKSEAS